MFRYLSKSTRSVGILVVLATAAVTRADLPEYGLPIPELAEFDQAIQDVLAELGNNAATVGVMKEGCIVYQRGVGWRDVGVNPLTEIPMMRTASIIKPIVARAIKKLEDDGLLSVGDYAFDVGQPEGGILNIVPLGGVPGQWVDEITVQHLLQHKAGWEGDFSWYEIAIADEVEGVDSPPGLDMTIRWALAQDLEFVPGDEYEYSNFGYNVLTKIIEEVSGQSYLSYMKQHIIRANMWVPSTEIYGGMPFYEQRGPREPEYIADVGWTSVPNVFDPDGPNVPWNYGGFDIQSTYGSSGLVMSVVPLLAFMHEYYPESDWVPEGSMPGSSTVMYARSDDIGIAVMCNERAGEGGPYRAALEIAQRISDIIDAGVDWPTACIDGFWVDCDAPSGVGSYDYPFAGVQNAIDDTTSGSRLQFHPGTYDWTGTISRRTALHSTLGTARIGDSAGCDGTGIVIEIEGS